NDEEVPYHAPETHDNAALKVLVESGKLNADSLGMMLLRKTDWHDYEGIKWLLGRGVDPNRRTRWGKTALHNAVLSDNAIEIFEVLLDHGADPTIIADRPDRSDRTFSGKSAVAMAARLCDRAAGRRAAARRVRQERRHRGPRHRYAGGPAGARSRGGGREIAR